MEILIATKPGQLQRQDIEGPTPAQAQKMAARRIRLLADAREALASGNDDLAFTLDCSAFDIECDLRLYGRDVETGRAIRRRS